MDQPGPAVGLQFAPQVADEGVHGVAAHLEVVPPDPFQQQLAGEDDAGVPGELREQLELPPGEPQFAAVEVGLAGCRVDRQRAGQDAVGGLRRPAAQQGAQPQHQLLQGEGLHQVVVRPGLQTGDPVGGLVQGGEHQDRDVVAPGAQGPADLGAADAGHGDVEHEDVRGVGHRRVRCGGQQAGEGRLAVLGEGDGEAAQAQAAFQGAADGRVVVHHQDPAAAGAVRAPGAVPVHRLLLAFRAADSLTPSVRARCGGVLGRRGRLPDHDRTALTHRA